MKWNENTNITLKFVTYNFFAWRKFKALNSDFQKEENPKTNDPCIYSETCFKK